MKRYSAKDMKGIRLIIFDWGDTLMRDFPGMSGPMALWEKVEMLPRADAMLAYLYGKYHLCVATNAGESNTEWMRKALARVDIEKYFSAFFSSLDLGVAKPDPAFFCTICSRLGFEASESLMIGNDYEKDIVGAHNAGMKTILFNEMGKNSGPFPLADREIHSLADLKELL